MEDVFCRRLKKDFIAALSPHGATLPIEPTTWWWAGARGNPTVMISSCCQPDPCDFEVISGKYFQLQTLREEAFCAFSDHVHSP